MIETGAVLLTRWCNIFGGEWDGGAKRVLGGLETRNPSHQWYCPTVAVGRYRMECEHGHRGQPMDLCLKHLSEFRKAVTFCPRCNIPPSDHKCNLTITEMS